MALDFLNINLKESKREQCKIYILYYFRDKGEVLRKEGEAECLEMIEQVIDRKCIKACQK